MTESMTASMSSIRLDVSSNREFWSFTPSEACESKVAGGGQKFSNMCEALGIDQKADDTMSLFSSMAYSSFTFEWDSVGEEVDVDELGAEAKGGDAVPERNLERASYQPTLAYLVKNGLIASDISEGSGCTNKLLFNVDIYTLREYLKSPAHLPVKLVRVGKLSGRSDIAVLFKTVRGGILRHQVRFLIEIKSVSAMKSTSKEEACEREAVTQTVGMNLANSHTSPPVILTNLAKKHKVFYIESTQKTQNDPIQYKLFAQKCDSFSSAVDFAYSRSEDRSKGSTLANSMIDFGRGPTPPNSVTENDVEEEEGNVESNKYTSGDFEELESDEQNLEGTEFE
jgi:hypothetical protein